MIWLVVGWLEGVVAGLIIATVFYSWVLHRRPRPPAETGKKGVGTERWRDRSDRQAANDGFGMCNTGAGVDRVCELGGIGCNVDHARLFTLHAIRRLERPGPDPRRGFDGIL